MSTRRTGRNNRRQQRELEQARQRARQQRKAWALSIGLFVIAAVVIAVGVLANRSSSASQVGCSTTEQTTYHIHSHLTIITNGQERQVPANIGIEANCLRWLHTHDTSGIIHVEAPSKDDYTLGQFFEVWGEPLSKFQMLNYKATKGKQVRAYIDGKPYTGNPRDILLRDKEQIVLEYGPPFVSPPKYNFPEGL